MKASRKGTRLNDYNYFKQPPPRLRNRMTAMCVLPNICVLRDKIRVTKTHDFLLQGRKDERIISNNERRGDSVDWDHKFRSSLKPHTEISTEMNPDEIKIKVGVKLRGIQRVEESTEKKPEKIHNSFIEDRREDYNSRHIFETFQTSKRPFLRQHWESMITTALTDGLSIFRSPHRRKD